MHLKPPLIALALGILLMASACNLNSASPEPSQTTAAGLDGIVGEPTAALPTLIPTLAPTSTPQPTQLTICLGREPASLFPYTASGRAAQAVLAMLNGTSFGPGEYLNNEITLPIEQLPTLENGALRLEPVTVNPGERIVDSSGALVGLAEGVLYRPAGCTQRTCELIYSGSAPIQMNQWVLVYTLLPELTWSDGAPLTSDDSLYGYQVAQALFPAVQGELLSRTASYTALDERTLEWRGLPGYQDGDAAGKFFAPLPRHAWGSIPMQDLPASEVASRHPLSWGAYALSEWLPGESITLERNPHYAPAGKELPYYDRIVPRFVSNSNQAAADFRAGACDVIDPFEGELPADAQIIRQPASWTLLLFGVRPVNESRPSPFASLAVRQAAAQCIDRAAVAQAAGALLAQAYVPAESPAFNPQAALPPYDPASAAPLLTSAGWVDADNDPATPRTALGAPGFVMGAPFSVSLYVSPDPAQQSAASVIQQGLSACGIQVTLETLPPAEYLAAGPQGPVFGRNFDLALFAWPVTAHPPCNLLLSREIPGEYPAYPKGWGGANAAGYARPEFDRACTSALTALPGDPAAQQDYALAQALLAEDLPFLPLYWQERLYAVRDEILAHLDLAQPASP